MNRTFALGARNLRNWRTAILGCASVITCLGCGGRVSTPEGYLRLRSKEPTSDEMRSILARTTDAHLRRRVLEEALCNNHSFMDLFPAEVAGPADMEVWAEYLNASIVGNNNDRLVLIESLLAILKADPNPPKPVLELGVSLCTDPESITKTPYGIYDRVDPEVLVRDLDREWQRVVLSLPSAAPQGAIP